MASDVLLAVFGAGASHGCLPNEPAVNTHVVPPGGSRVEATEYRYARPPLTQELVRPDPYAAAILNKYAAALPVIDAVRRRMAVDADGSPTESLEQALAEYQQRKDEQVNRHLAAMRFYLRDLLWACSELMRSPTVGGGRTNHVGLVGQLHTWAVSRDAHVCLTSFNYDFILESACEAVWGFSKLALAHHVSYDRMSLVKPHGSVLWEQLLRNETKLASPARYLRTIDLMLGPFELLEITALPPGPFGESLNRPPGIPALALPVDGKSELVWPPEQERHFASLQHRVSKLLIVGWRAVDQHFIDRMEQLTNRAKAVIVTGGTDAEEEAGAIRERLYPQVLHDTVAVEIVTDGFTGLLAGDKLSWLLAD